MGAAYTQFVFNLRNFFKKFGVHLPLVNAKNVDGSTMAVTNASTKFALINTVGTSTKLQGNTANNTTASDSCLIFNGSMPLYYKRNSPINIVVNCNHVEASGTTLTNTVKPKLYRVAPDGTHGADLVTTAAQAVPASAGNLNFTVPIAPTGLQPGDEIQLALDSVATEGGNSGTTRNIINSVSFI